MLSLSRRPGQKVFATIGRGVEFCVACIERDFAVINYRQFDAPVAFQAVKVDFGEPWKVTPFMTIYIKPGRHKDQVQMDFDADKSIRIWRPDYTRKTRRKAA